MTLSVTHLPLALSTELPIRVLAVVGSFTVGGLLTGWVFGTVLKRAFPAKPAEPGKPAVPRGGTALWVVRTLGGIAFGWIAALFLFGGGGPGVGGIGGLGFGSGKGTGEQKSGTDKPGDDKKKPDDKNKETPKDKNGTGEAAPVRVEVLGDAPLKKMAEAAKSTFDPLRRYRVDGGATILTLDEVKDLVRGKRKESPPVNRVVLVIYGDSPDRDKSSVADLESWVKDLEGDGKGKASVGYDEPGKNAPVD